MEYPGLGEPPFNIVNEVISNPNKIKEGIEHQTLELSLSPQNSGKHYLAFKTIIFDPDTPKNGTTAEIDGPVFTIDVTMPEVNFQPEAVMARLLPLSEQPPIAISLLNKKQYFFNPERKKTEAADNLAFIESKTLPWLAIITIFFAAFAILLIKLFPPKSALKPKEVEIDPQTEAKQQLMNILNLKLLEKGMYNTFFTNLDHIVRNYIQKKYNIEIRSSTTQEFLKNASVSHYLDDETRMKLISFLESSDRVKFAKHIPTNEECNEAVQEAQELIGKNKG